MLSDSPCHSDGFGHAIGPQGGYKQGGAAALFGVIGGIRCGGYSHAGSIRACSAGGASR